MNELCTNSRDLILKSCHVYEILINKSNLLLNKLKNLIYHGAQIFFRVLVFASLAYDFVCMVIWQHYVFGCF